MNEIIKTNTQIDNKNNSENKDKNLDERISEISLSDSEEKEIISNKTVKTIRDKALGVFKVTEIIGTILNWNEEVELEIAQKKKDILLAAYFNKTEAIENSVLNLKQLITNPTGNIIFNKILRILDNYPPDLALTDHLSNTLKKIIESDFESLFEDYKFALNQIEMITPQALTLLADYENWQNWPNLKGNNDNWLNSMVDVYYTSKKLSDEKIKAKISHAMNDLVKNRYVEPEFSHPNNSAVYLTEIGKLVYEFIK